MPSTIHLHRVLRAPPERVWRAFSDPAALVRWIPPFGFLGTVHAMDFRVGGSNRMSFTNFSGGGSHSFGAKYLEIVENERLVYTDDFDDPASWPAPWCRRSPSRRSAAAPSCASSRPASPT